MPSYKEMYEAEKAKNRKLLEMMFESEVVETDMWYPEEGISKEEFKEDWILSLEAFLDEEDFDGEDRD